ncbi:MAG: hypothetical protein HUU38_18630 [Anaerolineales bacterium]|nr:hypothetical protein [Anaerolineales bacterium]
MISLNFGREPGSSALDEPPVNPLPLEDAASLDAPPSDATLAPTKDASRTARSRSRPLLRKRSPKNKPSHTAFTALSLPHAGQD